MDEELKQAVERLTQVTAVAADSLLRIAAAIEVLADAAMQNGSGEEEEEGGYTSLSDH